MVTFIGFGFKPISLLRIKHQKIITFKSINNSKKLRDSSYFYSIYFIFSHGQSLRVLYPPVPYSLVYYSYSKVGSHTLQITGDELATNQSLTP